MALMLLDRVANILESVFDQRDSVSHFSQNVLVKIIDARINELSELNQSEYRYLSRVRRRNIKRDIRLDLRALKHNDNDLYAKFHKKYYDYLRNS